MPFVCFRWCREHIAVVQSATSQPTSVEEYLSSFIDEMKSLSKEGIHFDDRHYKIALTAVICDAPACAFIECIKTHSGYHACERCTQDGVWTRDYGVTFPDTNAPERTNVHFDEMRDEDQHTGISPLLRLKRGMVSMFPLDYMHLVCLS